LLCYIVISMNERFFDNWSTQLRKGMLEFCILNAIRGTSLYGYDIVRTLRGIEGLVISEGTIYPILSRLKREGLVGTTLRESSEGPARKYYALTENGEAMLNKMNAYWLVIKEGTDAVIKEHKE
jgi:PadR family transcriptional regulator, regulatory protein PadR